MRATSPICAKDPGAEDEETVENSCGSENDATKVSMCFSAILLVLSRLTFEAPSEDEPANATRSILNRQLEKQEK